MLNDLKINEKHALIFQLEQLFDHDETSAILATLQRIAERKAFSFTRRQDYEAAIKWQALADAFDAVSRELKRAHKAARRPRAKITDI